MSRVAGDYPNGYGLSIIDSGQYGAYAGPTTFEVAVTHNGALCYATPITSDVLGWQDAEQVRAIGAAVEALPRNDACTHRAPLEIDP